MTTLHLRKEGLNRPIEIVIVLSEGGKTVEPQPFLGVSVKKSGNVRNQSPLDSRCHQGLSPHFFIPIPRCINKSNIPRVVDCILPSHMYVL